MGRLRGLSLYTFCGLLLLAAPFGFAAENNTTTRPHDILVAESSDSDHLVLSANDLVFTWQEHSLRGDQVRLYEAGSRGFTSLGEPGLPTLPRSGGWILVPPGTQPRLKVTQESWQPAGQRRLMVTPVPVPEGDPIDGPLSISEILILPGETPPAGVVLDPRDRQRILRGPQPRQGAALSVGPVSLWRGRRIAPITLIPIRHDGQGVATEVLSDGTWEIQFVADESAADSKRASGPAKLTDRGDARFGEVFLNANLLDATPTEATWGMGKTGGFAEPAQGDLLRSKRGGRSGTLLGAETRLAVRETRLFRVTYERLRDRGQLPDVEIQEDQVRLYQRRYLSDLDDGQGAPYLEVEVPIHMVGEGDAFDGDDYFLFYGLRPRDDTAFTLQTTEGDIDVPGAGDPFEKNNEINWYWLAASEPESGESWARMTSDTLPAVEGSPLASYRREEHHEEQIAYRGNIPAMTEDVLYYSFFRDTEVSIGLNPLWSPISDGADCDIEIAVALFDRTNQRDLSLSLVTDGSQTTVLDDNYHLTDFAQTTLTYAVPASAIDGTAANIVMTLAGAQAGQPLYCWLNWVKIAYDAAYVATNNQLTFHGGSATGVRNMDVAGFTSSDLGVVEITDPRNPVYFDLAAGNVVADGETWTLSIAPAQTAGQRRFFAAGDWTGSGVGEYTYFLSEVADDVTDPTVLSGPAPDMIVVCHPEFREAAQRWIDHRVQRSGGDLNVHTVLVQDLYDHYSGGLHDPWAIKRFANHAMSVWGSWALTLIGDANENVRQVGVTTTGRPWSRDLVPTHLHKQQSGIYSPEQLASDKWYATSGAGTEYPEDDYPDNAYVPTDMYVGRLPCNSVAELDVLIDKIMTMESVQAGQDWRRRGIFFADDSWSNGYGDSALSELVYNSSEEAFRRSERDSLASWWRSVPPVTLEADTLFLDYWLYPHWGGQGHPTTEARPLYEFRNYTLSEATPPLIAALNQGGIVAHYQGHANPYVLSSEYWFLDRATSNRYDVDALTNTNSPWFFFGMGCHISDWAQNTVRTGSTAVNEQSLGEKFLVGTAGGACGSYGSSGFEYIIANRKYGEVIFRRWLFRPPTGHVDGVSEHRSRWVIGEMLWASEADMLALAGSDERYREMCAQYTLLGDPLMVLDAGLPQVVAQLTDAGGQEISGEVDLAALDETNLRVIDLAARDEAGIDRIRVIDSEGSDLSASVVTETVPDGAAGHQAVDYQLDLPIRPFDHSITVSVYDAAGTLDSDAHYELVLNLPTTSEFSVGGEVVEPGEYEFVTDEPVAFVAVISGSAWFAGDETMALTGENLSVRDVSFDLSRGREMTVSFTAVALEGMVGNRSVILDVDGYETSFVLEDNGTSSGEVSIAKLVTYPNPMRDETRFLFETGAGAGQGKVLIYTVAGRNVADLRFDYDGSGSAVVDWNGRDRVGDGLANGVYLYRVELDTGDQVVVSDMQRLAVMR